MHAHEHRHAARHGFHKRQNVQTTVVTERRTTFTSLITARPTATDRRPSPSPSAQTTTSAPRGSPTTGQSNSRTSNRPASNTSTSTSSTSTSSSSSSSSSSAAPSTTPPPRTTAAPVAPSASSPVTVTSTRTSTSATSTGTVAAANGTGASKGGLSGPVIGLIVAVSVIAAIAIGVFVIRKTLARRRRNKRTTWGAGFFPPDTNTAGGMGNNNVEKFSDAGHAPFSDKSPGSPPPPMMADANPYFAAPMPMPPPASYNNAIADDAFGGIGGRSASPAVPPSLAGGSVAATPIVNGETAIVRVLYIPTLPDELSITVGEVVRIVRPFDDGWALCANARGEQGAVPLECLDRNVGSGPVQATDDANGDWRNMKRLSSLVAEPTRY